MEKKVGLVKMLDFFDFVIVWINYCDIMICIIPIKYKEAVKWEF